MSDLELLKRALQHQFVIATACAVTEARSMNYDALQAAIVPLRSEVRHLEFAEDGERDEVKLCDLRTRLSVFEGACTDRLRTGQDIGRNH